MKKLEPKPIDAHVLVCQGKECAKHGASDLAKNLRRALKRADVPCRVIRTDCLDRCEHRCVVGYEGPRARWWVDADPDDAKRLAKKIAKRLSETG